ncbi:MAG: hypothetical protein GYB31_12190 [Bacteroidetes bacterium]|nr:hypothetical protein [Bacteroidota bacterium]
MEPYKPVACDFVDQIEIAALKKKHGLIRFMEAGHEHEISDRIVSWKTENKEEFLITRQGRIIRLDQILWLIDQPGPAKTGKSC